MDILATDLYLVPMVLRYLMMWVISTCSMEATFADVRKARKRWNIWAQLQISVAYFCSIGLYFLV